MDQKQTLPKMKPLTKKQVELLKECQQNQSQEATSLSTYYTQSSKGLVSRGLIEARPISKNGRMMMAFFLTSTGIALLQRMSETVKIP